MSDRRASESVQAFYETEATHYDRLRWRGPIGEFVHDTYQRLVGEALDRLAPVKCLEVGCGTGRFTIELARRGYEVLAIDVAPAMLRAARKSIEREPGSRVSFAKADVREYRVETRDRYDLVCSFNAINHIPDVHLAVDRMADAVRPGGALLLGFPSLYSAYLPYAAAVNLRKRSLRRGVYTQWISTRALTHWLSERGFEVEDARGMFHAPPVGHRSAARALTTALRVGSRLCESGPLRPLATTQIITFRKEDDDRAR